MEQCQLTPAVHLLPHLYITVPEFFPFFFFPSPQVKRSCGYAGFIWEIPPKLMIPWWLLPISTTVHILSPLNSSLCFFQSWAVKFIPNIKGKGKKSFAKTLNMLQHLGQTWFTVTLDDLIMYRSGSCSSEQFDGQTNSVSEKGKATRQAKGCSVEMKQFTVGLCLQKHFSPPTLMFICSKASPLVNARHVYYRHCADITLEKITMVWQPAKSF